jgi:hypothetical protein
MGTARRPRWANAKVRDRPRELEYAVIPAGGQVKLAHGRFHHVFTCFVQDHVFLQLFRTHVGIRA